MITGGGGIAAALAFAGAGAVFTICCGLGLVGCKGCMLPNNA